MTNTMTEPSLALPEGLFTEGTGPEHPVNRAHREWSQLKKITPEIEQEFNYKHTHSIFRFVVNHMEYVPYCKDVYNKEATSCSCLPNLVGDLSDGEIVDCATALLHFAKQSKSDQQIRVMDWIAYDSAIDKGLAGVQRKIRQKRSVLPGTRNEMICKHRLAGLIGYGKKKWTACCKLLDENKAPVHGLKGKQSNNGKVHYVYTSLFHGFFDGLKELATPRATRIVTTQILREQPTAENRETRDEPAQVIELRENDEDVMELPSSMTKRGLYKRFLQERVGIIQVLDAKCRVVGVRSEEEGGPIPEIYPSWRSFNRYWDKYWPKLIIAKPREDVCDDCWKYANAFRFKKREDPIGEPDDDDDERRKKEQDINESVIESASYHVEQAKIQRLLFNEKISEAKDSRFLQRSERRRHLGGRFCAEYVHSPLRKRTTWTDILSLPIECLCLRNCGHC